MKKCVLAFLGVMVGTGSYPAFSADQDGCWTGRHSSGPCLEYSTYEKDGKTYFEFSNVCEDRLYISWKAGKSGGADSLRGGKTKTTYEYVTGGRVSVKAIGSNKPSNDWVCAGKVSGWHD